MKTFRLESFFRFRKLTSKLIFRCFISRWKLKRYRFQHLVRILIFTLKASNLVISYKPKTCSAGLINLRVCWFKANFPTQQYLTILESRIYLRIAQRHANSMKRERFEAKLRIICSITLLVKQSLGWVSSKREESLRENILIWSLMNFANFCRRLATTGYLKHHQ